MSGRGCIEAKSIKRSSQTQVGRHVNEDISTCESLVWPYLQDLYLHLLWQVGESDIAVASGHMNSSGVLLEVGSVLPVLHGGDMQSASGAVPASPAASGNLWRLSFHILSIWKCWKPWSLNLVVYCNGTYSSSESCLEKNQA